MFLVFTYEYQEVSRVVYIDSRVIDLQDHRFHPAAIREGSAHYLSQCAAVYLTSLSVMPAPPPAMSVFLFGYAIIITKTMNFHGLENWSN